MSKIIRMTLFKLTDNAVIKEAIQKYSTLSQDAVKVRSCDPATCTSDCSITSPNSIVAVEPHARLMILAAGRLRVGMWGAVMRLQLAGTIKPPNNSTCTTLALKSLTC
jgi:hypothetical protein